MKKVYTLIAILALAYSANAQSGRSTNTAIANGNWNAAGTWSKGTVPANDEAIVIPNTYTVTLTSSSTLLGATLSVSGILKLSEATVNNTSNKLTIAVRTGNSSPVNSVIQIFSGGSIQIGNVEANGTRTAQLLIDNTANGAASATSLWQSNQATTTVSGPVYATSDGTTFLSGTASLLPAVLVSFDAVQQGNTVNVSWKTQQEQNTKAFAIEKSSNGVDYKVIGTVAAAGNSTTPKSYTFSDAASNGLSYYRVRILDQDGRSALTSVKAVRGANATAKVGVFPNPAVGVANVVIDNADQQAFTMNVFNRTGQLVAQQRAAAGTNFVRLDVNRFAAGDYMIDIQFANGSRQNSKMIVAQH